MWILQYELYYNDFDNDNRSQCNLVESDYIIGDNHEDCMSKLFEKKAYQIKSMISDAIMDHRGDHYDINIMFSGEITNFNDNFDITKHPLYLKMESDIRHNIKIMKEKEIKDKEAAVRKEELKILKKLKAKYEPVDVVSTQSIPDPKDDSFKVQSLIH